MATDAGSGPATRVRVTTADGIAQVVLDSPPLNILTQGLLAELRAALVSPAADPTLRVLVLGAQGKHFSAGADVAEHLPPTYAAMIPEFLATIEALHAFPVPVVAAVRGRCLGGGFELVQAADLIVSGEGASFGQPEIVLGVIAPAASALLPEICGPARAAEILYTGDAVTAAQALAAGLVVRVVADERVDEEALALAGRIARHSAAALRIAKRAIRAGSKGRLTDALRSAGRLYVEDLMRTADAREGLTAFVEKRPAVWAHR
jgi:cyclohexa-1,5-dienecarbonyl-CoA hydratase